MNDYSNLKNYCHRLYVGFLKQHIKATTLLPSKEEEDCVKAFCVLTHAAIEEYFEKVAIKTISSSYKKYKTQKFINTIPANQNELDKINQSLSQLIKTLILSSAYSIYSNNNSDTLKNHKSKLELASDLHKAGKPLTLQNISELTKKTDTYTKEILKETNKFFEHYVTNNHGASLKYLLKLLIPVGIDIPDNLSLLNSLQKLAEYRGIYAHTKGDLTVIISASDIAVYIIDALQLCKVIEDGISKFYDFTSN
ncbi:HEPN domain-containing protein [Mucilaginibacter sp. AW1-7]|uniref:HEPN domain-containing protein n=1 Tax=Mucilaginibacter sp. AW1-7 TaxID=3349874 RepID=UPI003F733407